ncbi:MAG: hypothetical protein ABI861_12290 [Panacibacter sp.]
MIQFRTKVISNSDNKERSKRILRFGSVAFVVILLNAIIDIQRGLTVSAMLVILMGLALGIILGIAYKGYTKAGIAVIVLTINPLLVMIAFAEGLQTGGYLFILPLMFALAFLIGNMQIALFEMTAYFFITVCSFCTCIVFCGQTTKWQNISPDLSEQMFSFNSISVICLCALFAYMGIYFERAYKKALLAEKNKANLQEQKIAGQNKHLQEIAFMSAHVVRTPLANILVLTTLIDPDKITNPADKEIIQHLQASVQQLDEVIKGIVIKTTIEN